MAEIFPTFDKVFSGTGSVQQELWVDLSASDPDPNSPIPNGIQLWLGYASLVAIDKDLTFEIRPNLPTKSLGTVAETQLRSFTAVPKGDSKDVDLYYYGNISTLAPVGVTSTGVEKLWLRVRSGSGVVGDFDYFVYYSTY